MNRTKWDLNQLKEVQKQQEVAMTSTEQVINKARNDLNSMTEEVWEGEDGDMARELLGELVYKEMPQTWKEIDTINTAIKKAQKTANESKNFCNEFSQIFKDGSLPSETDSAECSGELLCDTGSCDLLKAAMGAAGKNAVNVKRNIETVENILSELETPEAKFDYTSYTGPIKEQAQNVADRTMMFNNAVSRYESKVKEMDETLARELMEAIPGAVPVRFDPSILLNKDIIHMKDGDIVSWLKAYQKINIADNMGLAHAQSNIKTSSENQKPDLSDITNKPSSSVKTTPVVATTIEPASLEIDPNVVEFYNSLPKEVRDVLGTKYESYSKYISYTEDGFYIINKPLSEILLSSELDNEPGFKYVNDKGEDSYTPLSYLDDHYIAAIKNDDGTYTYTLIKIRPEYDVEGNSDPTKAGTAIPFVELDMDGLAEAMRSGEISDELSISLAGCVNGTKKGWWKFLDAADGNDELKAYFNSSTCQANYLIANLMIQKNLETSLYDKKSKEYTTGFTFNQFDEYCQHRLEELKEAKVVDLKEIKDKNGKVIDYQVIVKIDQEDGLSKDEIDAMMCVSTGNPTLLSFGAETQAHADMYSKGVLELHTVKADAGVVEDSGWTPEGPYKQYYIDYYYDENGTKYEYGPGSYVVDQQEAFGDEAYTYIDGYPKQ